MAKDKFEAPNVPLVDPDTDAKLRKTPTGELAWKVAVAALGPETTPEELEIACRTLTAFAELGMHGSENAEDLAGVVHLGYRACREAVDAWGGTLPAGWEPQVTLNITQAPVPAGGEG